MLAGQKKIFKTFNDDVADYNFRPLNDKSKRHIKRNWKPVLDDSTDPLRQNTRCIAVTNNIMIGILAVFFFI